MRIVHIEETVSTNHYLSKLGGSDDVCVWTDYQTAGRGCGTNSWESERGKNLLFSVRLHPASVPAASQFVISMANALALKKALATYVDDINIKWPNDIYWHDKKLGGTLIETTLKGSEIRTCIIGTGINVNQQLFVSDAPNPVSLLQILGHEVDREQILQGVVRQLANYMKMIDNGCWDVVRQEYHNSLYRLEEPHYYLFGGRQLCCKLKGVTDEGRLRLQLLGNQGEDCDTVTFAFKEVQYVL